MKAFKEFIKPFEIPQRSVKIKISLNFFSSSKIGTGRVNSKRYEELHLSRYSHANLHDCTFNNFLSFFLFWISETYFHFIILVIFYFA